jgi:hypothetical protein
MIGISTLAAGMIWKMDLIMKTSQVTSMSVEECRADITCILILKGTSISRLILAGVLRGSATEQCHLVTVSCASRPFGKSTSGAT